MKLLRICTAVTLCLAIWAPTFGQNQLNGWARTTMKSWESDDVRTTFMNPDFALYSTHQFKNSNWSSAFFADVNKYWGELIVGPRYKFCPYFSASMYAGVETGLSSYGYLQRNITDCVRFAIDGNLHYKIFNWFNVYEYGIAAGWDGDFWQSDLVCQVHKCFSLEAKVYNLGRDEYRAGGGVVIPIPKTSMEFAPLVLYNFYSEETEVELSVNFYAF